MIKNCEKFELLVNQLDHFRLQGTRRGCGQRLPENTLKKAEVNVVKIKEETNREAKSIQVVRKMSNFTTSLQDIPRNCPQP